MNTIAPVILEIQEFLDTTFTEIDTWFDKSAETRRYKPLNGGWSIEEVLEHIVLTSHFLLILIEKGTRKALEKSNIEAIEAALQNYELPKDKLDEVGLYQSFEWIRPQHMEPNGIKSSTEIRLEIQMQLEKCKSFLANLKGGEGTLYLTTMTVNNLSKIDVYAYIYFLGQHAKRHIAQMQRREEEFYKRAI